MDYDEREKLKSEGWKEFNEATTPSHKANIILHRIITAHYWRAKEELEHRRDCKSCLRKIRGKKYYPGYELDIDHYAENWIYAQRNRDFMKDGVYEELLKSYEPIKSNYLPDDCSVYQV